MIKIEHWVKYLSDCCKADVIQDVFKPAICQKCHTFCDVIKISDCSDEIIRGEVNNE